MNFIFTMGYHVVTSNIKVTMKKELNNINENDEKKRTLALRDCLDLWCCKWKILILMYLFLNESHNHHFKLLHREISGISAKMLSKELKELEINKLITRTEINSKPIKVYYAITAYGKAFIPICDALINWGLVHRNKIINESKS